MTGLSEPSRCFFFELPLISSFAETQPCPLQSNPIRYNYKMTSTTPNITVYSFRRCPFAIRVRMVLHEKGIPFHTVEESLKKFSAELLQLHPEGRVPVLVHNDVVIYESAIITEYLDDCFPEAPLMPKSAADKMRVREWTYWCNHIFKPEIDRFKYDAEKQAAEENEACKNKVREHLKKLESQLEITPWLVGNSLSLADIHVFPFYRQLVKMPSPHPDISHCPATNAWLEKIISRPSFIKTMEKTPQSNKAEL